jgi:hypothetical protein
MCQKHPQPKYTFTSGILADGASWQGAGSGSPVEQPASNAVNNMDTPAAVYDGLLLVHATSLGAGILPLLLMGNNEAIASAPLSVSRLSSSRACPSLPNKQTKTD